MMASFKVSSSDTLSAYKLGIQKINPSDTDNLYQMFS